MKINTTTIIFSATAASMIVVSASKDTTHASTGSKYTVAGTVNAVTRYTPAGEYSHIGDCGMDRYSLPESGAAGYCYIMPAVYTVSSPVTVTVQEETVTVQSTPASVSPVIVTPKPEKKHCNNGEGNGSEGCSPAKSERANNDENNTSPAEEHGKGKNKDK